LLGARSEPRSVFGRLAQSSQRRRQHARP